MLFILIILLIPRSSFIVETFCSWEVLGPGTFWGLGRFGAGTFCIWTFCSGRFYLWTICGRIVKYPLSMARRYWQTYGKIPGGYYHPLKNKTHCLGNCIGRGCQWLQEICKMVANRLLLLARRYCLSSGTVIRGYRTKPRRHWLSLNLKRINFFGIAWRTFKFKY